MMVRSPNYLASLTIFESKICKGARWLSRRSVIYPRRTSLDLLMTPKTSMLHKLEMLGNRFKVLQKMVNNWIMVNFKQDLSKASKSKMNYAILTSKTTLFNRTKRSWAAMTRSGTTWMKFTTT